MAYLDIITLERAKTYLRIDDTQNETDEEIQNMIKSALIYIEKRTNVIMFSRTIKYPFINQCVRVYDFPIIAINSPTEVDVKDKGLYKIYTTNNPNDEILSLNVGFLSILGTPPDVPPELIDAALQIIKVFYYEADKQANTTLIPQSVMEIINANRRFLL